MKAKDRIIRLKTSNPQLSTLQISKEVGCSTRHVRRIVSGYVGEPTPDIEEPISEEDFYRYSLMTGLKKQTIPMRYRKLLANLVMSIEDSLVRVPDVTLNKSSNKKEAAVLLMSDQHVGKLVFDDNGFSFYNKDICAFRLALLKERVKKLLTEHLRLENIDEFVICLLGDHIDGSGVYENQELNQDLTCFSDQISLAVAGIWDLIKGIRELGLDVKVYGVPGNHARQGKYAPVNNNLDYLVFQMLYMLAQYEDRDHVKIVYSTSTPYLNINVKGYKVHLRHIAPNQAETPSGRAKFGGWRLLHGWNVFCCGHRHHPGNVSYMDCDIYTNGSPVGLDDLAESMAVFSRPSQTLFGIAPSMGVSFSYNVYLDLEHEGGESNKLLGRYPRLG